MGLFDSISKVLGSGGSGSTQNNVVNAVMELLTNQQSGGLAGLVNQFKSNGLGDIINSWVGTGKNLPITPQQIQQGLGGDMLKNLAAKAGVSPQDITTHLSQLLPQVVDKLTPSGSISQGDIVEQGMGLLKGLIK